MVTPIEADRIIVVDSITLGELNIAWSFERVETEDFLLRLTTEIMEPKIRLWYSMVTAFVCFFLVLSELRLVELWFRKSKKTQKTFQQVVG
jgi:hypothetical protein